MLPVLPILLMLVLSSFIAAGCTKAQAVAPPSDAPAVHTDTSPVTSGIPCIVHCCIKGQLGVCLEQIAATMQGTSIHRTLPWIPLTIRQQKMRAPA